MDAMLQVGTSPTTVTTAVHVETFVCISVTVSVTVLSPIVAQLKVVGATSTDSMSQLSVLPSFISAAVMLAVPFTNVTVAGLHLAMGFSSSVTVTSNEQVSLLPEPSIM